MLSRAYVERAVRRYLRGLPIKVDFAILFGSTVYGDRLRDSDVDLIIVSDDFENVPFERRMLMLQKGWKHDVMLEALGLTRKEFDSLKGRSTMVQEAVESGRMVFIRKKRTLIETQATT